jgi:MFS family permease
MSNIFSFFLKDKIIAPDDFNRWRIPPASIAIHLCIGSVYAWSIFNPALIKELGVVTSSADDWTLSSVIWIFSVAIVFLGLAAALAGKWLEDVGPRCVGVTAAFLWGGGFIIGSIGILTHQLWLIYLGYGVFGGCGLGLGYVSPVSTLVRWFPDRRGMATGLAIMGFGGGAMIGAQLKKFFLKTYFEAPEYLGAVDAVNLITESGKRFATVAGEKVEVVVAGAADIAKLPVPTTYTPSGISTANFAISAAPATTTSTFSPATVANLFPDSVMRLTASTAPRYSGASK